MSDFPSTSSIAPLTSSSSTSSSPEPYSSEDSSALYYVYTQQYEFTDSTTSFSTGLPTTITFAKATGAPSSITIPTSTITTNAAAYEKWLSGSMDSTPATTSSAKSNVGTIVGSVVGSVGGVLVCGLVLWFVLRRRRHRRNHTAAHEYGKSFSHEIHSDASYSSTRSGSFNDENAAKVNSPPRPLAPTNPFNNETTTEARAPPPIPLPRKNNRAAAPHPGTQPSWPGSRAFSYASSTSDSSIGDDSTLSSGSLHLGSRYDSPSPGRGDSLSHPQGFFREII